MRNDKLREYLKHNFPKSVIFDDPEIDNSIVGISSSGNLIYDLDKVADELTIDRGFNCTELHAAIEDLIRSIPDINIGDKPMLVDFTLIDNYN